MSGRFMALTGVVVAAVLACTASVARKGDRLKDEQRVSFDVGREGRLSLSNLNGSVRVTGWDETRIEVESVKYADSQERLDEIEVLTEADGDRVRVEVDFDRRRWRGDGHARVDFTIRVPRGTRIDEMELVNGDLSIKDVTGRVVASSVNGLVTCANLSGDVDLSAVNGDVTLTVDGDVESIRLHSVNGSVELVVPRDANARVSASTVHGSIRSTGEARLEKNRMVGSSLTSVLGKGEGRIDIDTVNGNIRISRAGE